MTSKVAIFPWGEVIEVFLDPLGLTPEDFATHMRGGWLFGYVRALARAGVEAVIIYASERVEAPTRLTHAETQAAIWLVPGRRTGQGRTRGNPSLAAVQQWRRTPFEGFAKVVRHEGCDAILAQDYEHPRFDALAALALRLRLPLYATFQGGDITLSPLERRVRRASLAGARAVICASARERERLARDYRLAPGRVVDIPNPVDTEFWTPGHKPDARHRLGLDPETPIIINHGRIDLHRKGLDVLIGAWRRVAGAAPDASLVVIGSGQDREAFAALAGSVERLRWIDDYVTDPRRIRGWLRAADLYVTLSRTEGLPVAPLEALACGLPMVASDAHGLADIFENHNPGGLLVPRGDAAAAAAAILQLLGDRPARAAASKQARRTAQEGYGLNAVGARLEGLFQTADPKRPARALRRRRNFAMEDRCPG